MHGRAVLLLSFASLASAASQRAIDPLLASIAQSFGTTAGGAAIASTAFLIPLSLAWIGDVVPYERRQAVLAQFMIGGLCGFAFGSAAAGLLAEHLGWRWVFGVLGVINLLISARLWFELRANSLTRAVHGAQAGTMLEGYRRALALLARPWVRVMVITVFLEGVLVFGAFAFVPLDFNRRHGLGFGASGAMLVLNALGRLTLRCDPNSRV